MSLYIEDVIVNNFFTTYLLGLLTYRITVSSVSKKRAAVCALVGTGIAVWFPFCTNKVLSVAVVVGCWLVSSVILFARKQRFWLSAVVFLLVSTCFGGVFLGILLSLRVGGKGDPTVIFGLPPGILIAVGLLLYRLIGRLAVKVARVRSGHGICAVALTLYGTEYKLNGMLDTGNRLFDKVSGLPVVVVKATALLDGLPPYAYDALLRNDGSKEKIRCLSYTTVAGGIRKMPILEPSSLAVKQGGKSVRKDVVVGVSFCRFSQDYDLILPPSILE